MRLAEFVLDNLCAGFGLLAPILVEHVKVLCKYRAVFLRSRLLTRGF